MNRLILLVESRIRGDVYVRFGGEHPKTHRSNTAGRRVFSLHFCVSVIFLSSSRNILLDMVFKRFFAFFACFDRLG